MHLPQRRNEYLLRLRQPDESSSAGLPFAPLDQTYNKSLEALHGQLTALKSGYLQSTRLAIEIQQKRSCPGGASETGEWQIASCNT